MRDRDALLKIKKAKEYCEKIGKPVDLSILTNEGCWGGCSMMDEHYHYNSTRTKDNPQYFNDPISTNSCAKWDIEDNSHALKAANLPPWKSDWNEFLDLGIDKNFTFTNKFYVFSQSLCFSPLKSIKCFF